jgi:hypothetical protein
MLKIKTTQALQKVMQNKKRMSQHDATMLYCSVDAAIRQNLNNVNTQSSWTLHNDVFTITGPLVATTNTDVQFNKLHAALNNVVKTYAAKQLA